MAAKRGRGRPKGPAVGSILTVMVVGEAKKGVLVELGSHELLLPRSRYGAAGDRIEEAGYGTPLTVEVVAGPGGDGVGLSRVSIERSFRQPRLMEGTLRRAGSGFVLAPGEGAQPFAVLVLDRLAPDELVGTERPWLVGAPYRDLRMVEPGS
ncbi:MAG: hypothetical protein ACTHN0_02750 [Aquihabitans sp.]